MAGFDTNSNIGLRWSPSLQLIGIGPPSLDDHDMLRKTDLWLTEFTRSVNVRFALGGVTASRLKDMDPWDDEMDMKKAKK